jgi:hypothetical protein
MGTLKAINSDVLDLIGHLTFSVALQQKMISSKSLHETVTFISSIYKRFRWWTNHSAASDQHGSIQCELPEQQLKINLLIFKLLFQKLFKICLLLACLGVARGYGGGGGGGGGGEIQLLYFKFNSIQLFIFVECSIVL